MGETLKISEHVEAFNQILEKIKETRLEKIYVGPGVLFEDNLVKYITIYRKEKQKKRGEQEEQKEIIIATETHLTTKNISTDPKERYADALKNIVTAFQRVRRIKHGLKDVSPKTIIELDGPKNTKQMLEEAMSRKIKPYPMIKA